MVDVSTDEGFLMDHKEMAEKFASVSFFSKRQAEVFVLREIGGYDVDDVSQLLQIGTGTISEHSKRYREKIQKAEATLNLKEKWS